MKILYDDESNSTAREKVSVSNDIHLAILKKNPKQLYFQKGLNGLMEIN